MQSTSRRNIILLVIVSSLGYFVDIYDLLVFNLVKYDSLTDLGFSPEEIKIHEISILNWQMFGMLLGGILWGVYGDKKGRLSVLFGSIFLYSTANIVNIFVVDTFQYATVRFFAGLGLAGELGAGITLISEAMGKQKRGIGTMIVVSFGVLGALVAGLVAKAFSWQMTYLFGGLMGFALLLLRIGVKESVLFSFVEKNKHISKGNLWMILSQPKKFIKYLHCIFIGIPIWFVVGILIVLSNRFAQQAGVANVSVADHVMLCYVGLTVGDLVAGLLSQLSKSRKKIVLIYILVATGLIAVYLLNRTGVSVGYFRWMSFLLGMSIGYWGLFVTIASEQFGTNIRSTVTNTVPNFVRGSVPLLSTVFVWLSPQFGEGNAALLIGGGCILLALWSLYHLKETFGKSLDYVEE